MTRTRLFAALLLAAGVASAAPSQDPKGRGNKIPAQKAEDLKEWVKKTSGLKAEDQVAAFRDKMKALNPMLEVSDQALVVEVKKGVVVSVNIPATYATTIAPVAVFRDLEKLAVTGQVGQPSEVKDVAALKGMTRLKELNLAASKVADLKPLAALSIEKLYLNGTEVKSLAPLKDMPLKEVELPAGVEATELEVFKDKSLTWFSNSGKGPTQKQFETLFARAKLETFRASHPDISSLEPLRGMPLKNLILGDAPGLTDFPKKKGDPKPPPVLGPLAGCEKLRYLSVGKANIADISALAGKPLDHLTIADAPKLSDLSPIGGMKTISYLSVYRTGVSDLSPLEGMERLATLYLGNSNLVDPSPHQVQSLKPLAGLKQLKRLDLRQLTVADRDFTPLADLSLEAASVDVDKMTGKPTNPALVKTLKGIQTLKTVNGKLTAEVLK